MNIIEARTKKNHFLREELKILRSLAEVIVKEDSHHIHHDTTPRRFAIIAEHNKLMRERTAWVEQMVSEAVDGAHISVRDIANPVLKEAVSETKSVD